MLPVTVLTIFILVVIFFRLKELSYPGGSWALWVPTAWLTIICSRTLTSWIDDPTEDTVARFTESHPLDAAIYFLLIVLGLLILNYRVEKFRAIIRNNPILLSLFFYYIVSVFWSDIAAIAAKRLIKMAGDFVMVAVVLTEIDAESAIRNLMTRVSILLLPSSLCLIFMLPKYGRMYSLEHHLTNIVGVTRNKNELGLTCLVCGVSLFFFLIESIRSRIPRTRFFGTLLYGPLFVLSVVLPILANSITPFACLGLGGILILVGNTAWARRRPSTLYWTAAATFLTSSFALFMDESGMLLHLLGREATLTGRTEIWRLLIGLHTNPLIGTGYESFWSPERLVHVWTEFSIRIQEAHNGYLEQYLNVGWIGLLLMLAAIGAGFRNQNRLFRQKDPMALLGLAFITAALSYNLTEAGFRQLSPTWWVVLLAITILPTKGSSQPVLATPAGVGLRKSGEGRKMRILQ